MTADALRPLVRDLAAGRELVETHISWVFLGDDVWKVKKPVDLGFLDFSTLEGRRAACDAEVRLNRRLAAGVYRGVVPVVRGDDGRHRVVTGGEAPADGEVVDWAVWMERLDDAERADHLLAAGDLAAGDLARVAARLARFHAEARCDDTTARFGRPETVSTNVRENFEQTRDTIHDHLDRDQVDELEGWQLDFLERHAERFDRRVARERVRDGHGDLRLEHVYLRGRAGGGEGEVVIVDCIEFNDRFRYADVCADVAFLAMDLTAEGRGDLAERFLAAYAREADDFDLYPLVDFYESYRAFVRAKVASMMAADTPPGSRLHERAARRARDFYLLALASERRPLVEPRLVAVGGVIASGKSTVADALGAELPAPVVDSDRTRKRLLGVDPEEPLHHRSWGGAYTPDMSERVYAELLRRADAVLASGRSAVLDASFRAAEHRLDAQRLARRRGVPFLFVECRADPVECRRRLRRREREGGVSDGRLEIFDDFVAGWQAVDELDGGEHLVLDTVQPLEVNLAALRQRLPTLPASLA